MERKIGDTVNNPLMYITQPAYPPVKLKMQQSCVVKVSPRKKRELTEEVTEKVSETVQPSSTAVDISDIESQVKKNQITEEQAIPKKDLIEENKQKAGPSEITENAAIEKVEVPKKNINKIKKRTKKVLVKRGRIIIPKSAEDEPKEENVKNNSKMFFPPVEDQVKNNIEMVIPPPVEAKVNVAPVEEKMKDNVEKHVASEEEKLKSDIEYHVEPIAEKLKSNVEYLVKPTAEKLKSDVEYHVGPTAEKLKSDVEYHVKPSVEKMKSNVELPVEPQSEKFKGRVESRVVPAAEILNNSIDSYTTPRIEEKLDNHISSYAAPIEEKLENHVSSYAAPIEEKLENHVSSYGAPIKEKLEKHVSPYVAPEEKVKYNPDPVISIEEENKFETPQAPIENKFLPVEEKVIHQPNTIIEQIKNKRKPETLKDLLKEKLPGLQDVVEGKPVHLMNSQASQAEKPETQEEEHSKENEAQALKRRMISTYGIRSSFEKGKRATLKNIERSLPIINAQKLSELRQGKQLEQNIAQVPSVTENNMHNVEQQAINVEADQAKSKPKRFKEMSIHEKVQYLVNLPVIVPKVKCEIKTRAHIYQGVIAGYANGNVIIVQRRKPFRVEVKIDDILEINRKSF